MNNLMHFVRSINWLAVSLVIGAAWLLLIRVYYHAKPSLPVGCGCLCGAGSPSDNENLAVKRGPSLNQPEFRHLTGPVGPNSTSSPWF